ncbi:MAG: PhoPQ-activated pathogenicity-related family protein [Pirellulales bacterium]|nr:PhoPQ-activated pathogenicity-related family protein [Pirellulales bacterium]
MRLLSPACQNLIASWLVAALALLVVSRPALAARPATVAPADALAAYVAKADDSYRWEKRQERELSGVKFVELRLVSQTWKDIVWKHQLWIARPAEVADASQGVLVISGGGWNDELDKPVDPAKASEAKLPGEAALLAQVVRQVKAPVALLSHVPFQPVFDGMTEDEIIAYTFEQYLKTRDPEWPLLLPMVKAAVRAMDATQEFTKKEWQLDVKNFTVTGASKRGWTTWLTGAVDPRATAIAPIVIDMLNGPAQMKNQIASWGKYSEQIEDYTRRGIQQQMDTPAGHELSAMVDPYSYRHKLVQPKLLVMGTNDPYWCLDACNFYWGDLKGEKHLLYVPNKGHGVDDFGRLLGTIGAFHRQAAGQFKLPDLKWDYDSSDEKTTLTMTSDVSPQKVQVWLATAPTKDFRESKWVSQDVAAADGRFVHELTVPSVGYAAIIGEAVYRVDGPPFYLSTNVRIVGGPKSDEAGGK